VFYIYAEQNITSQDKTTNNKSRHDTLILVFYVTYIFDKKLCCELQKKQYNFIF